MEDISLRCVSNGATSHQESKVQTEAVPINLADKLKLMRRNEDLARMFHKNVCLLEP